MANLARWIFATLRTAAWAPVAVFATHVIAARVFHVYQRMPNFDIPMHFAGGVAIAYFFHVADLRGGDIGVLAPYQRLTHCLLVFGLTAAAAVGWEFAEFISDQYFGTRMQGGGLFNTLQDMFLRICGGISFLLGARLRGRLPSTTPSNSAQRSS